MNTLNGLGKDYENLVMLIENRTTKISFQEVKAWLLNHEQRLLRQNSSSIFASLDPHPNTAFTTNTTKFRPPNRYNNFKNNQNNNNKKLSLTKCPKQPSTY